MRWIVQLLVVVSLVGCASLHNAMTGQGEITVDQQGFDGSTVVQVSPSYVKPLNSGLYSLKTQMGAAWSSAQPGVVQINLVRSSSTQFGKSYSRIERVEFNVDGAVTGFNVGDLTNFSSGSYNQVSKSINTTSSNFILVPFDYFKTLLVSDQVNVRVHTGGTFEDGDLTVGKDGYGVSFVRANFQTFLDRVSSLM